MIFSTPESLSGCRRTLNAFSNNRIVITNGCFDLITLGHCKFLKRARALGDFLIVGINSDASVKKLKGESRPINHQEARAEVLDSLRCVDGVYIFDDVRCNKFIDIVKPNIYCKASDYSLETINYEEKESLDKCGTAIVFLNFIEGYSTTKIIEKMRT